MSRYSGNPELNPVKTQISMRRLNSACRHPGLVSLIDRIVMAPELQLRRKR